MVRGTLEVPVRSGSRPYPIRLIVHSILKKVGYIYPARLHTLVVCTFTTALKPCILSLAFSSHVPRSLSLGTFDLYCFH